MVIKQRDVIRLILVHFRAREQDTGRSVCVCVCACQHACFPISSPATISVSYVYMLFMSLTYTCLCVCACVLVCVCVCITLPAAGCDKVPVQFPRFTSHFHGLAAQCDVRGYKRMRSPDDSLHCAFILLFSNYIGCCISARHAPAQFVFILFLCRA